MRSTTKVGLRLRRAVDAGLPLPGHLSDVRIVDGQVHHVGCRWSASGEVVSLGPAELADACCDNEATTCHCSPADGLHAETAARVTALSQPLALHEQIRDGVGAGRISYALAAALRFRLDMLLRTARWAAGPLDPWLDAQDAALLDMCLPARGPADTRLQTSHSGAGQDRLAQLAVWAASAAQLIRSHAAAGGLRTSRASETLLVLACDAYLSRGDTSAATLTQLAGQRWSGPDDPTMFAELSELLTDLPAVLPPRRDASGTPHLVAVVASSSSNLPSYRAADLAPVFPVFNGRLRLAFPWCGVSYGSQLLLFETDAQQAAAAHTLGGADPTRIGGRSVTDLGPVAGAGTGTADTDDTFATMMRLAAPANSHFPAQMGLADALVVARGIHC